MAKSLESCKFDTYSSNTCSLVWMFLLFIIRSRRFSGKQAQNKSVLAVKT